MLPLFIMFILSAALALGLFNRETESPFDNLHVGQNLPDFSIASMSKDTVFSPKLFGNGQVVVVNVFASWCEPCAAEHSLLMKLAHKVNIYGIAWKDKPAKVFSYLKERGNPFQQIGVDETGEVTIPLGLTGVPETFVLNKKGQVVVHYKAPITDDLLNQLLIPLVDKLNHENVPAR